MPASTTTRQHELEQLASMVADIRIAMMTTASSDGHLFSKPMTVLELDREGAFWFFCEEDPRDLAAQTRHEHINLAFADEAASTFVSVTGKGSLLRDPDRARELWRPFASPWFPDGPDSPNLTLLRVLPIVAEYWDGPDNKLVRSLALAASMVAGKPVAMGQHEVLDRIAMGRATR